MIRTVYINDDCGEYNASLEFEPGLSVEGSGDTIAEALRNLTDEIEREGL